MSGTDKQGNRVFVRDEKSAASTPEISAKEIVNDIYALGQDLFAIDPCGNSDDDEEFDEGADKIFDATLEAIYDESVPASTRV
jgi:hypothetical protein